MMMLVTMLTTLMMTMLVPLVDDTGHDDNADGDGQQINDVTVTDNDDDGSPTL